MKKIGYLCIGIIIFMASCGGKDKKISFLKNVPVITIHANKGDVLALSEFADSVELIPLETRDENLIGWIPRIIATNDYYYINAASGWHSKKLFVFDKQGNYIRQISKEGGGPEEYVDLRDFSVIGDTLIKISAVYNMLNFDTCGVFLSSKKQRDTPKEIYTWKGKTISYSSGSQMRGKCLLTLLNEYDEKVMDFFDVSSIESQVSDCFSRGAAFTSDDKYCYFNHPFSNVIYGIDVDNQCEYFPYYQVDYGDKNLSWDAFGEKGDAASWGSMLEKQNAFLAISEILDLGKYLIVNSIDESYNGYFSIYSKLSGKVLTGQRIKDDCFFKGNMLVLKALETPHYCDGNSLLWVVEPKVLLEGYHGYRKALGENKWDLFCKLYPHLTEVCSRLDEESNPVLLKIKLKDF